jgi:hypothetical protein
VGRARRAARAALNEEELAGGIIGGAQRVGDTVRRPTGEWTPAVHALLRHLERRGFAGAPRVLGIDEQGREILTYLDGEPGSLTFPEALHLETGVATFGRFVRAYHDAVADFRPAEAVWRAVARPVADGEVVCHGDLGHWNTVWRGDELVGAIDWDMAEPGPPLRDLVYAAAASVPLLSETPRDRPRRLAILCDAYGGVTPVELIDAALETLDFEVERLESFDREPWVSLRERGQQRALAARAAWIRENRALFF